MYDVIQSALTATAEFIAIAGITLIVAHAFYTQHCKFKSEFCPPVVPITTDPWAESKKVSCKLRESKVRGDFKVPAPTAFVAAAA
jgi:hypothetical protein